METIIVREDLINNHGFKLNEDLFYYFEKGGEYSVKYWRERFFIPMQYFYGKIIENPDF